MSLLPSVIPFSNPTTLRTALQDFHQGIVAGIVQGNVVATMPSYDTLMVHFFARSISLILLTNPIQAAHFND